MVKTPTQQENPQPQKHTKPEEAEKQLKRMATVGQDKLLSVTSVFPMQLFPDTITIDRVKVTITRRDFFQVSEEISTQIEDILNVESDVGPFFGSINLYTRFFVDKPLRITWLSRRNTIAIKNILQGYIISQHQGIDSSAVEVKQLKKLLFRLGSEHQQLR